MKDLFESAILPGRLGVLWIGQGGFALKSHGSGTLVVDPYLSESADTDGNWPRLERIPVAPEELRLDYLALTHDHLDHTDPLAVPGIAKANPEAPIIAPPASAEHLIQLGVSPSRIIIAKPGCAIVFPRLTIHPVMAEHTEDSVGYVFDFVSSASTEAGPRVYITGDSEYNDQLAEQVRDFKPNILMVPINGLWGNMTAAQAAKLTAQIAPDEAIPMHYGMFSGNTADPKDYVDLLFKTDPSCRTRPVILEMNAYHEFCE